MGRERLSMSNQNNQQKKVIIVTTGGTIEKVYDDKDGSLINRSTIIEKNILERLKYFHFTFDIRPTLAKDSLYLNDEDRQHLANTLSKLQESGNPIIVLHGTDTMDVTLSYCAHYMKEVTVPIVFTGAMKPMIFVDSDAFQNVVEAIFAGRHSPPGLYLVFHGEIYKANSFKKDLVQGTFVEKS
jgi:L-asparaginase